jgi:hypothetical protein
LGRESTILTGSKLGGVGTSIPSPQAPKTLLGG